MSEQKTTEKLQSEEATEVPCIYGSEIRSACSVRKEAQKGASLDLSKWIKPNIKDEYIRGLSGMMDRAMNALTSMNLDRFCSHCPWRELYLKSH